MESRRSGRPRDEAIDQAVLAVARRHLATRGLNALSVAAVADEAGTTRPAVYRRWPNKLALAVAAVSALAETDPPVPSGKPFADLVAELEHFRGCITEAGSLSLAGLMLSDAIDPALREKYIEAIVMPRRRRLRACLEAAGAAGLVEPTADFDVAVTMLTGSWYAYALAGQPAPPDWPQRLAALVWRCVGGDTLRRPTPRRDRRL